MRGIREEIGLYPSAQRKRAGGWWKPDEAEVCEDHFRAALQNLFAGGDYLGTICSGAASERSAFCVDVIVNVLHQTAVSGAAGSASENNVWK